MSFTQIPDALFDAYELDIYDLGVAGFIAHKTIGWGKSTDGISRSQFVKALKISSNRVKKSLDSLAEKGIIDISPSYRADGSRSFNRFSFSDELSEAGSMQ